MARTPKPALQRLKETILSDLSPDEQVELGTWYEAVLEVREADRAAEEKRKQRKTATAQVPLPTDTPPQAQEAQP